MWQLPYLFACRWTSKLLPCPQFSSVAQSCLTLRPHGLQHTRLPCPSPIPGAYSNSCPLNRWCHPTISSSVVLAVVNSTAMNNRVPVSFSVMVSPGYMPSSGIAGSYGSFIPSFSKNFCTVLHSGCISLHSHQQCDSHSWHPIPQ